MMFPLWKSTCGSREVLNIRGQIFGSTSDVCYVVISNWLFSFFTGTCFIMNRFAYGKLSTNYIEDKFVTGLLCQLLTTYYLQPDLGFECIYMKYSPHVSFCCCLYLTKFVSFLFCVKKTFFCKDCIKKIRWVCRLLS